MAKHIATLFGGMVEINEDGGKITVSGNESVGGGQAAGVVQGQEGFSFDLEKGVELAEQDVSNMLPAAVKPYAPVVFGVLNPALKALE